MSTLTPPLVIERPQRRGIRHALLALLAFLVALPLTGASYELAMASGDLARYPAPGRLVDVGGYRLHIHCLGQGGPTVVLSSGAGGYSTEWSLVQPVLAQTGRVCAYDRAGLGWSDPGTGDNSPGAAADELYRLLVAAGEGGPYLLVGQSLGARAVQLFARRHPEQVAGLVLVDPRSVLIDDGQTPEMVAAERQEITAFQQQLAVLGPLGVVRLAFPALWPKLLPVAGKLSPAAREEIGILQAKAKHRTAALAASEQMRVNNGELRDGSFGALPLLVIGASDTMASFPGWSEALEGEAARSSNGRLAVAEGSHHMIQWDQPEVVVAAVREVLAATLAGAPLAP